jgi:hypothetical protein
VRLEADPLTLRERITAREPAEWSGLPQLLDAVNEIALASRSLGDVHLVCSTEDASPLAVGAQIRRARPEVLGGNSSCGRRQGQSRTLARAAEFAAATRNPEDGTGAITAL